MDDAERAAVEKFNLRYRLGEAPARRRVEQAVLGSDYGATSYTTISQAARCRTDPPTCRRALAAPRCGDPLPVDQQEPPDTL